MLIALTTGQMLVLALVAGVFIVFALVSSFLLPRRDPNFPGSRVKLFSAVSVLLAAAMLGAMFFFAVEEQEEAHPEEAPPVGEAAETEPPAGGGAEGEEGDPEAGAEVFASAGCGGCHTFAAAGTSGTVAPDLDEAAPPFQEVVETVTNGRGAMPAFGDQLSAEQIRDVAAFVAERAATG